jgi:hypothetical protein
MTHSINLLIHITAGSLALIAGLIIIFSAKGTRKHIRIGQYFLYLLAIVVSSGFFGWLFFRSNPFLLMLTLLAGYNTYAGYRAVRLREMKSSVADMMIAFGAFFTGIFYMFWLMGSDTIWSPSVIYPTVSTLALVTLYDLGKHFLFYQQTKKWWLYEHIYKLLSSFSAIFSAFIGTVLPNFKPYSQIGPSTLVFFLTVFFIWKQVLIDRAKSFRLQKGAA